MKKEKLNRYPTHSFVVAMENKVFASSFFLMIGGIGTAVYAIGTNNGELLRLAINGMVLPATGGNEPRCWWDRNSL